MSIGEGALITLDACLTVAQALMLDVLPMETLISSSQLSALYRATHVSVLPHLRCAVYRILVRVCTDPVQVIQLVKDMPSIVRHSVNTIVEYDPLSVPQWEGAGAAEWLSHVFSIAKDSRGVSDALRLGPRHPNHRHAPPVHKRSNLHNASHVGLVVLR